MLTRLPAPHRAPADVVHEFLRAQFPEPLLVLDSRRSRALLAELSRAALSAGAIYDALVAATARAAGATLVSCDRRASLVYERLDVAFRLIG